MGTGGISSGILHDFERTSKSHHIYLEEQTRWVAAQKPARNSAGPDSTLGVCHRQHESSSPSAPSPHIRGGNMKSRTLRWFGAMTLFFGLAIPFRLASAQVTYTVTDLGTLGGTLVFPFDLNNRSDVVGT